MKEQKTETQKRMFVDRDRQSGDRYGYPSAKDDWGGGDRNPGQDRDKEKIDRDTRDRCVLTLNPRKIKTSTWDRRKKEEKEKGKIDVGERDRLEFISVFSTSAKKLCVSCHTGGKCGHTTLFLSCPCSMLICLTLQIHLYYTIGAFYVSNLMEIKRRMIDIGKKNNFIFLAKCLKMYSFFRICIQSLQKVLFWRLHNI